MSEKIALVTGVANERSIAFNICNELSKKGYKVFIGVQPYFVKNVQTIISHLPNVTIIPCDVTKDEDIQNLFNQCLTPIATFIHCPAFASKRSLQGKTYDIFREDFLESMNVSVYSIISAVKTGINHFNEDSSIILMTHFGSSVAIQNYNLMGICKAALESTMRYLSLDLGEKGIRINAISSGAIPTMASTSISHFNLYYDFTKKKSPLNRNVTSEDVANMALFLSSPAAKNITGQVMYVDAGVNTTEFHGEMVK